MKYLYLICLLVLYCSAAAQGIPLPEHPRPDFARDQWVNLNGQWQFEFDSLDRGLDEKWFENKSLSGMITVPFPWGSALSGVKDEADIAWYRKSVTVPISWDGSRTFITIGASDWETQVWLDGKWIGSHRGGYMPFSFDLSPYVRYGQPQNLVIRADDKRRMFTLYGKQGYGNARGIWQTVYLESRGRDYIESIQCFPDIDRKGVAIKVFIPTEAKEPIPLQVTVKTPQGDRVQKLQVSKGNSSAQTYLDIPQPRLWNLRDPYLYDVEVQLGSDRVRTYFGMRKISVTVLPGTTIPYIALNDEPIYLQLALDQSYHPAGYYTFPSDSFMRQEIERSKAIGLNGIRTHIKPDLPRKLYWADKLGLLVMADLPNSWGEPDEPMRQEAETTLREMIKRDFNHPSIFSWIVFNETWGLTTRIEKEGKPVSQYLPHTQHWVASMYYLAKSLDPTRLVEDNSICCGRGHTETDIYSWHEYLAGWEWENHLNKISENNYPGSPFHFEPGFQQQSQPNINSECGNVWGYEGSTGDVDWSYDYHRMINTFRKFPKVAGWLYTEHHDVINEWNGYWRFDRSNKFTGLEELVPGMNLQDLHSKYYISTGNEICKTTRGGEVVTVPLYLSIYDSGPIAGNQLALEYTLDFTDAGGETSEILSGKMGIDALPWDQKLLQALQLKMPDYRGLGILRLVLKSGSGEILHRNFMHFEVQSDLDPAGKLIFSVRPDGFTSQQWSSKYWNVLEGKKVNGAGAGYFDYRIPVSKKTKLEGIQAGYLVMELSAKQLFDKDLEGAFDQNQNYMLGSRVSPHKNPNAYPMTDEEKFPSEVNVLINGRLALRAGLDDDPADHRGVLSWHHQLKDKRLREAGSYGYLIKVPLRKTEWQAARSRGYLSVRLQAPGKGGLAVYGSQFGRYPVDINLVLQKNPQH